MSWHPCLHRDSACRRSPGRIGCARPAAGDPATAGGDGERERVVTADVIEVRDRPLPEVDRAMHDRVREAGVAPEHAEVIGGVLVHPVDRREQTSRFQSIRPGRQSNASHEVAPFWQTGFGCSKGMYGRFRESCRGGGKNPPEVVDLDVDLTLLRRIFGHHSTEDPAEGAFCGAEQIRRMRRIGRSNRFARSSCDGATAPSVIGSRNARLEDDPGRKLIDNSSRMRRITSPSTSWPDAIEDVRRFRAPIRSARRSRRCCALRRPASVAAWSRDGTHRSRTASTPSAETI